MNPACCRYFHQLSNKRLNRARRLYARLVFEACWNGGYRTVLLCARRAKQRGLYAESTCERSIRFSILSKMHKLFKEANPSYRYQKPVRWNNSWYNFMDDFSWLFHDE